MDSIDKLIIGMGLDNNECTNRASDIMEQFRGLSFEKIISALVFVLENQEKRIQEIIDKVT